LGRFLVDNVFSTSRALSVSLLGDFRFVRAGDVVFCLESINNLIRDFFGTHDVVKESVVFVDIASLLDRRNDSVYDGMVENIVIINKRMM
jgi:hypothetical protein